MAIISVADIVNPVARRIAAQVAGTKAITPLYGRGQYGADYAQTLRCQIGVGLNANVAAALVIGLEAESAARVAESIAASGKTAEVITVQALGGSVKATEQGVRLACDMALAASEQMRELVPLSGLILGVKTGGSDTTSGISANPAMGWVVDRVVAAGGTAIFSEPVEMMGIQQTLAARAVSAEVARELVSCIDDHEREAWRRQPDLLGVNPSPDNILGGITTEEEKALGGAQMSGHEPIRGVLPYGGRPSEPGLYFMDGPSAAIEVLTGLAASGAVLVLFSTGVGNPAGSPIVPVVKLSGNPQTVDFGADNIDFDISGVTLGMEPLEAAGARLLAFAGKVASGRATRAEALGDEEFAISRIEPSI